MPKNIINKLISAVINKPKIVIYITIILSILLISGIGLIKQDDDLKRLLPDHMPSIITFNEIEEEFGNFEFMFIAIGDSGRSIFTPEYFKIAWNLTNDIEKLEECELVVSVSNTSKMYFDYNDSKVSEKEKNISEFKEKFGAQMFPKALFQINI